MVFGLNEAETSAVEALLHAGGLTHPFPQIEKLRSSHFTSPLHLDGGHLRAMQHENTLDTDALEDPAHGDGFMNSAVALCNNNTLIGLDPFLIAFTDAYSYSDGVSDVDVI